jgi:hypothetical protein
METRSAAIHRKMRPSPVRLPITGSAHKTGNGRRPLAAVTAIARSELSEHLSLRSWVKRSVGIGLEKARV